MASRQSTASRQRRQQFGKPGAGKPELFELLEPHLAGGHEALPRPEICSRLKLSSAALAMSLHRMRRRYGELLRQEIAATVDDLAEVDDDLRALMAIVSPGAQHPSSP